MASSTLSSTRSSLPGTPTSSQSPAAVLHNAEDAHALGPLADPHHHPRRGIWMPPSAADDATTEEDVVVRTQRHTNTSSPDGETSSMGQTASVEGGVVAIDDPHPVQVVLDGESAAQWASQWPAMAPWVTPFEPDRRDYANVVKYPDGCAIEFHPRLMNRMLEACGGSARRLASRLRRGLGFEIVTPPPEPTGSEAASGSGWSHGSPSPAPSSHPDDDDGPILLRLAKRRSVPSTVPGHGASPNLQSTNSVGGNAGSSAAPSLATSLDVPVPPMPAAAGGGGIMIRRGVLVRPAVPPTPSPSGGVGLMFQPPSATRNTGARDADVQSQATSAATAPRVLFEDEGSPIDRIRELESEVNELKRQLRTVKHERPRSSSNNSPTLTQPVIAHCKPQSVPAGVPTTVRVHVTQLDADFAPYSIKVGRSIVPCVITDRRVLSFVTPMLPPGSTPLQVMCTTEQGSVRRYGRAVWIESKPAARGMALGLVPGSHVDPVLVSAALGRERLTRHAVNQLAPEVPLPSGSTLRDPSETGHTSVVDSALGKSEYDDGSTDSEGGAAQTATSAAIGDIRVPLTREMLDMFAGRLRRVAGSDTASEPVSTTHRVASIAPPDTTSVAATSQADVDGGDVDDDETVQRESTGGGDAA